MIKYLRASGIPLISPQDWPPASPDLLSCDSELYAYLEHRVSKRRRKCIAGLKRIIVEEVAEIPQEMVLRALASWPRRVWQVYKAQGGHIENKI